MNTIIGSSESSGYKVSLHTLNEVFREQLLKLHKLCISHNNAGEIKLCKKWLTIFSKCSDSEKLARNCLCALMQQQIEELGYLEAPFTDLQNCNRDLEKVLQSLDSSRANSVETPPSDDRNYITFDSHSLEVKCPFQKVYEKHISQNLCNYKSHILIAHKSEGDESNSMQLRRELDLIRKELSTQQMENMNLKKINKQQENDLKTANEKLMNFEMNMLEGLECELAKISAVDGDIFPIEVLQSILQTMFCDSIQSNNEERLKKYRNIDQLFQMNLQRYKLMKSDNHFENINAKLMKKTKDKYKKKYRGRFHFCTWVQNLQIKLIRLKLFSSLREICIKYKGVSGTECIWSILEELENRYQSVINEVL